MDWLFTHMKAARMNSMCLCFFSLRCFSFWLNSSIYADYSWFSLERRLKSCCSVSMSVFYWMGFVCVWVVFESTIFLTGWQKWDRYGDSADRRLRQNTHTYTRISCWDGTVTERSLSNMSDMQREVFLCLLFSPFLSFFSFSSFSTHFISICVKALFSFPMSTFSLSWFVCNVQQIGQTLALTHRHIQSCTFLNLKLLQRCQHPLYFLCMKLCGWCWIYSCSVFLFCTHTHTLSALWLAVHERRKEGREHRVRLRAGPLIGYMNQTHALRFFDLS